MIHLKKIISPHSLHGLLSAWSAFYHDRFCLDENNMEYIEFNENPTKTCQSGLSEKTQKFSTKDVLQLEMISVPLQSSTSSFSIVLPNYA